MAARRAVNVLVPVVNVAFHDFFRFHYDVALSAACCKPLETSSVT